MTAHVTRDKKAAQAAIDESNYEITKHLNRLIERCEQEANESIKAGNFTAAKEHRENVKLLKRAESVMDYFDPNVPLAE